MDDDGLFGDPGFKQHGELMGKHRPAEIEALRLVALMSLKKCQLFPRFHTLGNDPKLHAPAHADYSRHDGRIVRSGGDLSYKRLVDLQRIDRELSEIAQAGVACTKIIDGNLYASGSQSFEDGRRRLGAFHQYAFRQLEFQ